MKKLLIVEDEINLCNVIKDYFSARDFEITIANNGNDAIDLINNDTFDILFLDIMIPGIDGLMVCNEIRKNHNLPIIFLTAISDEETQLKGYYLGADDYVTKPYSLAVLYAKAMSLLKRYSNTIVQNGIIVKKDLVIDLAKHEVKLNGIKLDLALKEYELLIYLVENEGIVKTREQILDAVWGIDYIGYNRAVDTHIKLLRKKLQDYSTYIKTVIGCGYKWEM